MKIKRMIRILTLLWAFIPLCLSAQSVSPIGTRTGIARVQGKMDFDSTYGSLRLPQDTLANATPGSKAFKGNKEWTKKASGFWEESGGVPVVRAGNGITSYGDSVALKGVVDGNTQLRINTDPSYDTSKAVFSFEKDFGIAAAIRRRYYSGTGALRLREDFGFAGTPIWQTWGFNNENLMDGFTVIGVSSDNAIMNAGKPGTTNATSVVQVQRGLLNLRGEDSIVINKDADLPAASSGYAILVRDSSSGVVKQLSSDALVLKQTQLPSPVTITGGGNRRIMGAGADITISAGWSAGRLAATANSLATAPLASIVVGGVSQTFTQPNPGSSVSGTQSLSVVRNVNTTFRNVVTTTDGKKDSAATTVNWLYDRFATWVTDTTGIGQFGVYNDALIRGATIVNQLSNSKQFNFTRPTATTSFLVLCYVGSSGPLSSILVGGLENIGAFRPILRNFTNADGATYSAYIYVNAQAQTSAITPTVVTQ